MEDNRKGTWEDVTDECIVNDDGTCGFVEVRHNGTTVGWLGHRVEGSKFQKNYRMTSNLAPEDARGGDCGKFKVEHFTPGPEPVIAYKAVIVEDGKYVSTFAGVVDETHDKLTYSIGETTTSKQGIGIYCADTLEIAMKNYPPANSDERCRAFDRRDGRVVILKVEGIGAKGESNCAPHRKTFVFPSVKVLSVAWEEEKKEEWVDVTAECKSEFNAGYVHITHNGNVVAELGQKSHDTEKDGYRVSSRPNTINRDHAGFITVEKRNG